MPNCQCAYEPREDSTLLEKHVRELSFGKALDMGTGSGIQAISAAQSPKVSSVLAVDIQQGTINYCRKNIKNKKIKFMQSDLFSNVRGKFDVILFNPPYLPDDRNAKDIALDGGKQGYEVLGKFLSQANSFLSEDGIILILFSSMTKKEKVDEIIKNNFFESVELEKSHFFFEELYVYKLWKNPFCKKFEKLGITGLKYLAKGHRGLLFTGNLKSKKIVIKVKNPKSAAAGRISNEAKWLRILNKKGIGPKLLKEGEDYFMYGYIDGGFISDFAKKSSASSIRKVLRDVFGQMYTLDMMKADKEEMHHPYKHVLVKGNKACLIDFERMRYVKTPKNVTQFCQFLISSSFSETLYNKGFRIDKVKIMQLAKVYKKEMNADNFKRIVESI